MHILFLGINLMYVFLFVNFYLKVRWADIEQKREQDKQRAIGFIVGQTDWKNLIDEPRDHSNALTAVKYIEKVRKT